MRNLNIRKRPVKNSVDSDDEFVDNFVEPEEWTIITALDRIWTLIDDNGLSVELWMFSNGPLTYLKEKLGLSKMQIIFLTIMIEAGEVLSWKHMGNILDVSRINLMTYTDDIEDMVKKRWVVRRGTRDGCQGFALEHGVITALRHNETFIPEKIDGLDIQQFMDRVNGHFSKDFYNPAAEFEHLEQFLDELVNSNPHLPLCLEVMKYDDIHIRSLFLLALHDYSVSAGASNEGLELSVVDRKYPMDWECSNMRRTLESGNHPLIVDGFIEHKCVDGIADNTQYVLTRRTKEELLAGFTPAEHITRKSISRKDIIAASTITKKELYYNDEESRQMAQLKDLLGQEKLQQVQQRLEEYGMRKGFACLFYGGPGTGKTESVLQIARETGRDILQVNIADLRDKYVGESEKNIKEVFCRYRELCKNTEVMPILFFNEADAIFSKRTSVGGLNPTVEKMENAMQNIILQEMENLDGILIATTNLTCNLDDAFERRFIFKIEFHKPEVEAKAKIWRAMMTDLSEEDALSLAREYDFSGGQIENIARKHIMQYVLSGKKASLDDIRDFCDHELLGKGKKGRMQVVGFAS